MDLDLILPDKIQSWTYIHPVRYRLEHAWIMIALLYFTVTGHVLPHPGICLILYCILTLLPNALYLIIFEITSFIPPMGYFFKKIWKTFFYEIYLMVAIEKCLSERDLALQQQRQTTSMMAARISKLQEDIFLEKKRSANNAAMLKRKLHQQQQKYDVLNTDKEKSEQLYKQLQKEKLFQPEKMQPHKVDSVGSEKKKPKKGYSLEAEKKQSEKVSKLREHVKGLESKQVTIKRRVHNLMDQLSEYKTMLNIERVHSCELLHNCEVKGRDHDGSSMNSIAQEDGSQKCRIDSEMKLTQQAMMIQ